MKNTGALIAAAGIAENMNEFRPMLKLSGTTLIGKEIDTLRKAGISPIAVVTGHEAAALEKHLSHRGVVCIRNEKYETSGMFESVKLGLSWLADRCANVLFLPADAPMFSAETVQAVMRGQGDITVPAHGGVKGHPVMITGKMIPRILSYAGPGGLRGFMEEPDVTVSVIDVEDPGIVMDVDDREAYGQVLEYEKQKAAEDELTFSIRVMLSKKEIFFGPGTAELLRRVDREGSLLSACKSMGMSYSKGWKMLKSVEDTLGFPFLERKTGGADGGNSVLTEKGRDFLDRYTAFEKDTKRTAEAFYQMHFGDFE